MAGNILISVASIISRKKDCLKMCDPKNYKSHVGGSFGILENFVICWVLFAQHVWSLKKIPKVPESTNKKQPLKMLKMLAHHWPGSKSWRIQFPGATTWRLCAKAPLLFLYLINIIMSYYIFIFILAGSNIYWFLINSVTNKVNFQIITNICFIKATDNTLHRSYR